MKTLITTTAILLIFCFEAIAMKANVDVYRFQAEEKPYVEVFFYILGNSVAQGPDFTSSVQVKYMLMQDTVVSAGDKYNLVVSKDAVKSDFMDMRRHYLPAGSYTLIAEIKDNNNPSDVVTYKKAIIIEKVGLVQSLSDIQLLNFPVASDTEDKWTKHHLRCIPIPFKYYSASKDQMHVYSELYNVDRLLKEDFYMKYTIAATTSPDEGLLVTYNRLTPNRLIPNLEHIDISRLTSGQFVLKLAAYSKDDVLLAESEVNFTRSNPDADQERLDNFNSYFQNSFTLKMDSDSVRYALKALAPKVAPDQVTVLNHLIAKSDLTIQREYIHRFWLEVNPSDPEWAYNQYMAIANEVHEKYQSGLGYGFETARGNIFLKYGAPDDLISVEDEPSAPPYEIWVYYSFPVTGQNNVKFLFYAPQLGNEFDLLHSTCENELNNPAWEQILYSDALTETRSGDFIDATSPPPGVNRRAREYFNDL